MSTLMKRKLCEKLLIELKKLYEWGTVVYHSIIIILTTEMKQEWKAVIFYCE